MERAAPTSPLCARGDLTRGSRGRRDLHRVRVCGGATSALRVRWHRVRVAGGRSSRRPRTRPGQGFSSSRRSPALQPSAVLPFTLQCAKPSAVLRAFCVSLSFDVLLSRRSRCRTPRKPLRSATFFPCSIARFANGRSRLVFAARREADARCQSTSADCYRALGYASAPSDLERDANALMWRCLVTPRRGERDCACASASRRRTGVSFTPTCPTGYWSSALSHLVSDLGCDDCVRLPLI